MTEWEAVLFDFDGVILDSANIKTEAFRQLFEHYGKEVKEAVVAYHLDNGGISRFKKFEYIYQYILQTPLTDTQIFKLGKEFSSLVFEKLRKAPFIPGAIDSLKHLYNKTTPTYVVSGTPHDELKQIVAIRKIEHYFVKIYGSPRTKPEIINSIIDKENFSKEKVLFIGDTLTDYTAAKETCTQFLGITTDKASSPFPTDALTSQTVFIP